MLCTFHKVSKAFRSSAKLLTKWESVLRQNITSFGLWERYLRFRQTNYTSFTLTGCVEVYEECIDTLMTHDTSGMFIVTIMASMMCSDYFGKMMVLGKHFYFMSL
jgi:hypothetical protein